MKLAESFVNLPAWGFWGVVIAAAGIPIGVWAAFHAAHTKTRLYYTLTGDTSLLGGAARDIHQLEVFKSGVQLHDPYIAYLKIRVRGRNDIGEDAFPKGDPLAFKIGTPIVDILKTTHSPVNAPEPTIATKDSVLNLGPDLIHHHAVLDLTLLLEGPPALDPAGLILKDVDLQRGVPPTVKINQIKELLYTTIGGVGVTIVTILVILVH